MHAFKFISIKKCVLQLDFEAYQALPDCFCRFDGDGCVILFLYANIYFFQVDWKYLLQVIDVFFLCQWTGNICWILLLEFGIAWV